MLKSKGQSPFGGLEAGSVSYWAVLAVQYLVCVFYLSLEWLFFATKASFMSSFTGVEMLGSLLIPPVVFSLGAAPLILLLGVIRFRPLDFEVRWVVPAFFLASSLFLLVDNFLYTVLGVGVITSGKIVRFLYLVLFLFLFLRSLSWVGSLLRWWIDLKPGHPLRFLPAAVLCGALFALGAEVVTTDFSRAQSEVTAVGDEIRRPNIILLSTDGVEARLMSVYGFPLPTTPFLEKFADRAVVFENAFPTAGKTTGTLSSMLSGSLPSESKVGFPPQIFPKEHAALHLPSMLQQLGYDGFQSSIRYYADAGDLNMISSFDVANERLLFTPPPGSFVGRLAYLFSAEIQFSTRIVNRLLERLLHVSGIKPIINHYLLVKESVGLGRELDNQRLGDALAFVRAQEGPYFLQIHLMATHCCGYEGARSWFDPDAMPAPHPEAREELAGYLSSIRDADEQMQTFVEHLEASGELENSILVIASDHSQRWDSIYQVPLIVYFPEGQRGERIERNVSLAQVPATILEYMGVERPAWMTQRSLFSLAPPRDPLEEALTVGGNPPILSLASFAYTGIDISGGRLSRIDHPGPPVFGVKEVGLVLGPFWKKLDLESGIIETGTVSQHTAIGDGTLVPPPDPAAREYIVRQLQKSGFTIPSFVEDGPSSRVGIR